MRKCVDAYLSVQSPYSYFALPRLLRLSRHPDVEVQFRLVMPGVLRIPDAYANRGKLEQGYICLDILRTAAFCGMDYAEAEPYPVEFEPGSLWCAASEQPRVYKLLDLIMAASDAGKGLAAFDALMRLIWDGKRKNWHLGNQIKVAVSKVGLDWEVLTRLVETDSQRLRASLLANNQALLAAGHWGVPCFVVDGEPFYGQDRFDQLVWRLGVVPQENFVTRALAC